MFTKKNNRRALLISVISLVLCCAMLMGTTFAWFTDSVTSGSNIIQSGTLDVEMYWADGKEDPAAATWADASTGAIFNYDLWEPGYTEVRHIKIHNNGTLALKYQVLIQADQQVTDLSDVIDVYYADPAVQVADRSVLANAPKLGTLTEALAGMTTTASGELAAGASDVITIALKMQETAGNDYMDKTIGSDFRVLVNATQLTSENDSFDDQYDFDASYVTPVKTMMDFFNAVETQSDIRLEDTLQIDAEFMAYMKDRYPASTYALADGTTVVDTNAFIDGNGITVYRTEAALDKAIFEVETGYTLTLSNITLDGGAEWTGEVNPYLLRGTVNSGMTASNALVTIGKEAHLVLNEGAVLQNNDGANAVNLGTRAGATLTINGGEIINNHSAAGAIWGGGEITMNSGKVNGNHGGIGGAIRAVTNIGTLLTMNGGEMNHNYSDSNGGAIWAGNSKSNNVYVLNGGEMAYNYSATTGGAIYAGYYETVKIGGTFKMHDNACDANIGSAIRFHDHATLVMTGGEVYKQAANGLYLNNNSATITGGTIDMDFGYSGGLGLKIGQADINGVISYNLATNHNTAYLDTKFNAFEFTVNESAANFANFHFEPADGYVYETGDETKLVCLNEGYSTVWDTATGTFRLAAN